MSTSTAAAIHKDVLDVFKESDLESSGTGSATYKAAHVQLDKILVRCKYQLFVTSFTHPIKLYLCCNNSRDVQTSNTCRFIARYINHLIQSISNNNNNNISSNSNSSKDTIEKEKALKSKKKQVKEQLLTFIYGCTDSKETIVRLRALQIIYQLLNEPDIKLKLLNINGDGDLKTIIETRCQDKVTNVRLFATNLACKYYTIEKDESYMDDLLMMMNDDTIWNIRNNLLMKIVPLAIAIKYSNSHQLLGHIIKRTKDVREEVRSSAYIILSKWYKMEDFTPDQIKSIVENGLDDPIEKVKKSCIELLTRWLEKLKKDNPHHYLYIFLEMMDVMENGEMLERCLMQIYDQAFLEDFSLTANRELTNEQAFHFKLTVKYLHSKKDENVIYDERLEAIIPTLTEYRNVIVAHLDNSFIIRQLLESLRCLDLADEVGRNNLENLLIQVLKAIRCETAEREEEIELIKQTLSCMSMLVAVERTFIVQIVEMLSDMRDPLEEDPYTLKLREFEQLKEEWKDLGKPDKDIQRLDTKIELVKLKLKEQDTQTLRKCSDITHYLLLNAKKFSNSPEIDGLLDLVILPSIQHSQPDLRQVGIQNLGIFCLHRRNVALSYLNLFEKIIENDNHEIQLVCLKVIFDILLVFGSPKTIPRETVPLYKMIRKFSQNTSDITIKMICIEGFVKLLYSGIIQDQKILIFLLLELLSPSTKDLLELRKCLYLFFQAYVSDSLENKILLFNSIMMIYQSVTQGLRGSSYASINLVEMTKFLLFLFDKPSKKATSTSNTSPTKNPNNNDMIVESSQAAPVEQFHEEDIHPLIAIQICQELISCFRGETKELTKVLHLLQFDKYKHQAYLVKIYQLLDKLSVLYTDSFLDKFKHSVSVLIKSSTHLNPDSLDLTQLNGKINASATSATGLMQTPTKSTTNANSKSTPTLESKKGKGKGKSKESTEEEGSMFSMTDAILEGEEDSLFDSKGRMKFQLTPRKEFNINSVKAFFERQKKLFDTVEKREKKPTKRVKLTHQESVTSSISNTQSNYDYDHGGGGIESSYQEYSQKNNDTTSTPTSKNKSLKFNLNRVDEVINNKLSNLNVNSNTREQQLPQQDEEEGVFENSQDMVIKRKSTPPQQHQQQAPTQNNPFNTYNHYNNYSNYHQYYNNGMQPNQFNNNGALKSILKKRGNDELKKTVENINVNNQNNQNNNNYKNPNNPHFNGREKRVRFIVECK